MSREPGPYGVYVHVPWCRVRCPYCAFYVVRDRSAAGRPPAFASFVDAVLAEHALRTPDFPGPAATVFLGGGTPSRLPGTELRRLLDGLPRVPGAEVSAEVNPEDVAAFLGPALDAGVNRISLGIQSFDPSQGRRLGRAHSQRDAADALAAVGASGVRSWSADLMFALPGQTLADLERDLDALLAHDPPHVAVYGLTIEPGTPFERANAAGRMAVPDDDAWREMYDRLVERLAAAGLLRYEVSNFAKPGHESAHNLGYWQERPYLGLGPSAHGLLPDGARYVNAPDLTAYLRGGDPTGEREPPDPERIARDALISALRCRDGIDLDRLSRRTGYAPRSSAVERLIATGLLARTGSRIALAGDGWPLADAVVGRLVDALAPSPRAGAGEADGGDAG